VSLFREQIESRNQHIEDLQQYKSVPLTGNVLGRSLDDDAICYLSWPTDMRLKSIDNEEETKGRPFIGQDYGQNCKTCEAT